MPPITIIGCGYVGTRLAMQIRQQAPSVLGVVRSEASARHLQDLGISARAVDLDTDPSPAVEGHWVFYFAPPATSGEGDQRIGHGSHGASRALGIETFFEQAAGYAVFPSIGKGGVIVGGAYGKGLVIVNQQVDGYSTMTQASVGLQIGAQKYAQFIFFRDQVALEHFKRGNFEFGAQATAVAITAGASASASTTGNTAGASGGKNDAAVAGGYNKGYAIFTIAKGGLMYEASIGGGGFTYEPL